MNRCIYEENCLSSKYIKINSEVWLASYRMKDTFIYIVLYFIFLENKVRWNFLFGKLVNENDSYCYESYAKELRYIH